MSPHKTHSIRRSLLCGTLWLTAALASSLAHADGIYSITGLGTLSGQSSSVATSINNSGQVVGISYNSSDGYFTSVFPASANPPRFTQTGSGAESFLYSGGQMTQINPNGGLAMSINDSGQVVGGQYASINNQGQYVGGQSAGILTGNYSTTSVLLSGGTTTTLPQTFVPYSINGSGQIAGLVSVNTVWHPAVYANGQLTDLLSKVPGSNYYDDSRAIAINAKGDMVITLSPPDNSIHSYLYKATTGVVTEINPSAGSSGALAAALNNSDQVVGNGFLYSNGSTEALASLLPSSSGWSNLNATGINDAGQIVGQGTYNGQLEAFEMTPNAIPEPGTLLIWGLIGAGAVAHTARRTARRSGFPQV